MKQILTLGLFLFFSFKLLAQTDGISYQALIIGPGVLELPGVDSENNYLPTTQVGIRFTIFESGNQVEFQEEQTTTTDEFGRVNLIIGAVEHDYFEEINWDGTPKDLKVEIDFGDGNGFVDMSREQLTFVPYAYHRNITATGTLDVDDNTFLNGELQVEGPTNLNSTLTVNNGNESNLSGDLTVDGESNLNSELNVNNNSPSYLSGDLTVDGNSLLNGTLNVVGKTTVGDFEATGQSSFSDLEANTLTVNTSSNLLGTTLIDGQGTQVRITSSMMGTGPAQSNHPVLIDGGTNGLAIKVNGSRNNNTNFITFYDGTRTLSWGRIEGETKAEYGNNADWLFDQSSLDYDIYDAWVDYGFALANEIIAGAQMVKAASDYRPCTGFGACIVTPGPADIIFSGLEMISATAQAIAAALAIDRANENKATYNSKKDEFQGVTYASGAGDYAEYLLRENTNEAMDYGDIVGVKGGKISKNTAGAEKMMVVSFKPIVLGNMPQSQEEDYEKVAFMGQVPVKVFGRVNIGDYIIPSGKNDGVGIAISPSEITIKNVKGIVGIAWTGSESIAGFNMVNVAVGLNKNDNNPILQKLEDKIEKQANEISDLKKEIAQIHDMLAGNVSASEDTHTSQDSDEEPNTRTYEYDDRKFEIVDTPRGEIIYFEMTKEDFEKGLELAQEEMRSKGIDVENHIFWKKIKNDEVFKNEIMDKMKAKFDKQIHFHKEVSKKAGK